MTGCNFTDCGGYAFLISVDNDTLTAINATNNWWGTTDPVLIEDGIYHQVDYSLYPLVDFVPFAESPFAINCTIVGVNDDNISVLPDQLELIQNYPNPFNAGTVIEFHLPRRSDVRITVYDILGRLVRTLHEGSLSAGPHSLYFDGRDDRKRILSSGIYFYRLQVDSHTLSRKMILLK